MEADWTQESKDAGAVESHGKYISAIYRHMQILIAAEMAPFRIGSGQYIFLMAIAGQEQITQKALSEELLIDKTTTAKAIAKLEAEGYVRREADPADNRFQLLYLTEAGQGGGTEGSRSIEPRQEHCPKRHYRRGVYAHARPSEEGASQCEPVGWKR